MLYLAIGIIGATVMPHNLYLHSSIVQTRAFEQTPAGKRDAIRWATTDQHDRADLRALHQWPRSSSWPHLPFTHRAIRTSPRSSRRSNCSLRFWASVSRPRCSPSPCWHRGLNSTVTATLAGQIVMEGFLRLRLPPWMRRLITRALAIVPVLVVTILYGDSGAARLLVFSQVVLSMQLPFAVIPLVRFVSQRRLMGDLVAPRWLSATAWVIAGLLVALNLKLLFDTVTG